MKQYKIDCFAYTRNGCRALIEMDCENCSFYEKAENVPPFDEMIEDEEYRARVNNMTYKDYLEQAKKNNCI
ncbi:hypothetical protein HMPREF9630_00229 [Peptoanaerobacter stomatis]|uniref:Uncharacterized protein n=1 Tax=Peptoanaerobacter stomatis TaxID=796937 RepID=V9HV83_9FIRM|nr:hypothetical protein [Peptoanaerobacter stomatis]EHL18504.1 hypothetical protein HMPREF9630_00229 [Peptoanaerobacter stomatis]